MFSYNLDIYKKKILLSFFYYIQASNNNKKKKKKSIKKISTSYLVRQRIFFLSTCDIFLMSLVLWVSNLLQ